MNTSIIMLKSNCHHLEYNQKPPLANINKDKKVTNSCNCIVINNTNTSSKINSTSMFNLTNYNKSPVMKTLASILFIIVMILIDASQQQSTNDQFEASNYKDAYSAIKAHPRLREFGKLLELDGVRILAANDQTELTIFAPVDDAMEDLIEKAKSRSFNLAEVARHHIVGEAIIGDENSRYPISVQSQTRSSPLFLTQPLYQEEGLFRYQQQQQQQQQVTGKSSTPMAPIFVNNAKILESYVLQNGDGSVLQVLHVIDHIIERLSITQLTSIRTQNVQMSEPIQPSLTNLASSQPAALTAASYYSKQQNKQQTSATNDNDFNASGYSLQHSGHHSSVEHQQFMPSSKAGKSKTAYGQAQLKKPVNLDNVLANQQVLYDFYEKYSDLTSRNSLVINKLHTRTYSDAQLSSEYRLDRDDFDLERLIRALHQHPQLFGLLYNTSTANAANLSPGVLVNNQTTLNQYNTYFLPLPTSTKLFDEDFAKNLLVIKAHVIPNKVLFTRTMGLGRPHNTMVSTGKDQITLNLAKTVHMPTTTNNQIPQQSAPLGMPLFVQSNYYQQESPLLTKSSGNQVVSSELGGVGDSVPKGIVNSEIVVANIPLTSGVLHLIRKPLVVSDVALTEYLNDHNHQLSHVLGASGTLTRGVAPYNLLQTQNNNNNNLLEGIPKVNKFRELLAKDNQLYKELLSSTHKTILVPSDEAFESIRYDLRALINQDEQLIPSSWDNDRRQELMSSLLKKHIIMHNRIIASDKSLALQPLNSQHQQVAAADVASQPAYYNFNGQPIDFYYQTSSTGDYDMNDNVKFVVTCDSMHANILHHNLAGYNGVIHIIDRVLGEEPETVYSLLKSIVLKYQWTSGNIESARNDINQDINQLIESNMNNKQRFMAIPSALTQQQQQLGGRISKEQFMTTAKSSSLEEPNNSLEQQQQTGNSNTQQQQEVDEPKLFVIAETIKQYLEDPQNVKQLELLSKSVNISYQLAKSSKDGSDDWNERFKQQDKLFTYFVPSDLAWLRLQQRQPRLHEPLMSALAELEQVTGRGQQQQQQQQSLTDGSSSPASTELVASSAGSGRASESSQRLRQILERHVVMNRKITKRELDQLNSLQTMRATLKVSDKATSPTDSLDNYNRGMRNELTQESGRVLCWESSSASIVNSNEAINGAVHIIDNVMVVDSDFQTSPLSSSSSLLSSSSTANIFYLKSISPMQNLILLSCSLVVMIIICTLLVRHCLILAKNTNKKITEDEEEDQSTSGPLTSAHSNTTGSTSTTKSL